MVTQNYPTQEPVIPTIEIVEFLEDEWNILYVPQPLIYSQNDGKTPVRNNLTRHDIINVIPASPSQDLKPIGNWVYGSFIWRVQLHLWTVDSRERLWKLQHEIMNISFRNLHTIPNFQRITYQRFSEVSEEQVNIWHGRIDLELESKAVQLRDRL